MHKTSKSRSLQFAVSGALLVGVGAPVGPEGVPGCVPPEDPIAEEDLTAQTAGTTVVNPGPAAPPHPIAAREPTVVNPGPVPRPTTMR